MRVNRSLRRRDAPLQPDLVDQAQNRKSSKKKTAGEKTGGSDDPFANSDLAQDDSRIEA